jgi:hypothetical protein
MGVALGDLDGDGRSDLTVTNFLGRSTVGFRRLPGSGPTFEDASASFGLTRSTRDVLGFGVAAVDFDGDGRLDLIQANGHVLDRARLGIPFEMRPTLLRGDAGRIPLVASTIPDCDWFNRPILGRGLAIGDLDGDRRPDVAVAVLRGPACLLRNESVGGTFAVLDVLNRFGRPAVGAHLRIVSGRRTLAHDVTSGGSYLSSSEPCVFVGGCDGDRIERIEVDWPWGERQVWSDLKIPAGRRLRLIEGAPLSP